MNLWRDNFTNALKCIILHQFSSPHLFDITETTNQSEFYVRRGKSAL